MGVHSVQRGGQDFSIDQAHDARAYDGPASADSSFTSVNPQPAPAPQHSGSQRRLRIDARAPQQPPARHQSAEPETLAGAMFRLHEALAPYLGVVAAAALVVSGSLLYWSALGKPQTTSTPSGGGEKSIWASELPSPEIELPRPEEASADPSPTVSEVQHDSGTRVADATASQPAVPAEPEPQPSSAETPAAPSGDGPSLTPAAPDVEPPNQSASTTPDEAITPTPETGGYPTTPYATFWFIEPAAVAQRPSSADSAAPH
jgi:hypothetical protein